jgi:hypothetical protein
VPGCRAVFPEEKIKLSGEKWWEGVKTEEWGDQREGQKPKENKGGIRKGKEKSSKKREKRGGHRDRRESRCKWTKGKRGVGKNAARKRFKKRAERGEKEGMREDRET